MNHLTATNKRALKAIMAMDGWKLNYTYQVGRIQYTITEVNDHHAVTVKRPNEKLQFPHRDTWFKISGSKIQVMQQELILTQEEKEILAKLAEVMDPFRGEEGK